MQMLNKVIIIEDDNKVQCDSVEEVVKTLIDEKYYELTLEQRKNKMKMLAMANTLNKKMEIVDNCSCDNINGKFIIKDEFTYILSLLICGNIVLLEKKESNVFIKYTNVPESKDNYIIVNKFAKDILKSYLKEQRGE